MDRSGAVIPTATVIVTNQDTNQVREAKADDTGKFTLTFLPVGTYTVRADKEGFGSSIRKDVLLQANTTVQTDAQLEVRSTSEQIQVTAEATLVQATSTTLVQVVDTRRVQDLPLNGRNVLNLMQINAGVSTEGATGHHESDPKPRNGGDRIDQRLARATEPTSCSTTATTMTATRTRRCPFRIRMLCRSSRFKPARSMRNMDAGWAA